MPGIAYRYEIRQGDEIVSTGRFAPERAFQVGERTSIGGRPGIVQVIEPILGERELHLVVQLLADASEPE